MLQTADGIAEIVTSGKKQTVAVLGASPKPHRYSHQAIKLLQEKGYLVIPVHPKYEHIEGLPVFHDLRDIKEPVDTLTVYVGPEHVRPSIDSIIEVKPSRVILNPGAESEELKERLEENNIPYLEACTLVLLNTEQF